MTDFHDLYTEVTKGEARLLADTREGQAGVRRIIVQRSDGSIWGAWDLFSRGADRAEPWGLVQMEYAYRHPAIFGSVLDHEALFHAIQWAWGSEERAAAIASAEKLLGVTR